MKQKIDKGKFKFITSLISPGMVEEFVREALQRHLIRGPDVCHCFSGKSLIGSLREDIEGTKIPDHIADIRDMPKTPVNNLHKNVLTHPAGTKRFF